MTWHFCLFLLLPAWIGWRWLEERMAEDNERRLREWISSSHEGQR